MAPIVAIGTPITIRQIIAEAIFYQSLTEITRDMVEASFEGYAADTNMATVNSFRISSNALQEAYAIVAKEIHLRQFQTAFLINTISTASLLSGAGSFVRGTIALGKGVVNRLTNIYTEQLARKTLTSAITNGVESVVGFSIHGTKSLSFFGNTLKRNIILIESNGRQSIGKLLTAFESEAVALGANKLVINGLSIINQKLLSNTIAGRFGFIFKRLGSNSFKISKNL